MVKRADRKKTGFLGAEGKGGEPWVISGKM